MATAFIGVGSNIGDRAAWIRDAIERLDGRDVRVVGISSLYLTEPVGDPALPWFVNGVVAVRPRIAAAELARECRRVESQCGRRRPPAAVTTAAPSSRTLDLDLLLYDQRTVDLPGLQLPHPRLHERRFVLEPLREIAPRIRHPVLGKTVAELYDALPVAERVWLLAPPAAVRHARARI